MYPGRTSGRMWCTSPDSTMPLRRYVTNFAVGASAGYLESRLLLPHCSARYHVLRHWKIVQIDRLLLNARITTVAICVACITDDSLAYGVQVLLENASEGDCRHD